MFLRDSCGRGHDITAEASCGLPDGLRGVEIFVLKKDKRFNW
jgi:hypothetical protein